CILSSSLLIYILPLATSNWEYLSYAPNKSCLVKCSNPLLTVSKSNIISILIILIHNIYKIIQLKIKIYNTFLYILSGIVYTILTSRYDRYLVIFNVYHSHIDIVIIIINLNNIYSQT